jgi:tetratricopeptide (TPR) repeat protein
LNNRATCFFILDRYEDAVLDVSQVLERYPHDQRAFYKRGLMFERAGKLDKALEDYQSALKLESNWTKVPLAVERLSANGVTTPEGFDNNLRFVHGCDQSSQDSDSDREDVSCDAEIDDNDNNDESDSDGDDKTEGAPIHYKKRFIGEKIASVVECTIDHQLLPKEGSYSIDGKRNRIMHLNAPSFVVCRMPPQEAIESRGARSCWWSLSWFCYTTNPWKLEGLLFRVLIAP